MTKIKICGLKRPEDIRAVNEAQPDFAGFVIEVSKSRRNVSVEQVRELAKGLPLPFPRKSFPWASS